MKIGFFGDSFVHNVEGWPKILMELIGTNNFVLNSFPGGCEFNIMRAFEANFVDCDIVIVVHTDEMRLANAENFPINTASATGTGGRCGALYENENIWSAACDYYNYIAPFDFHTYSHLKMLENIDSIMAQWHEKKFINLFAFEFPYVFKHGITVDPFLAKLSKTESHDVNFGFDTRANHFNTYNNNVLANQIYMALTQYKVGKFILNEKLFQQIEGR